MKLKAILTFEQASAKAESYLDDHEKLRKLVEKAARKSKRHYESLLPCWESLQIFLRLIKAAVKGKYTPPLTSISMAVAAIIYFVSPLDMIPDSIPVLGLVDDACIIASVAKANLTTISNFRKWEILFAEEPVPYWKR